MTPGAFTVATWNIEQHNSSERVLEYLRGAKWDIACLQETRDRTVEALRADAGWQTVDWRQVMPAGEKLGKHPHGAVILGRNGWSIRNPRLLPNDAFAGRGVIAQLARGDRDITVVSWHSAHGAAKDRKETNEDGRKRKMRGYEALGVSLKELTGPVVLASTRIIRTRVPNQRRQIRRPAPSPSSSSIASSRPAPSTGSRTHF